MKPYQSPGPYTLKLSQVFSRKSFTLLLIFFTSIFNHSQAQCVAPNLVFSNPVLIGGIDGQVGASYRFPNVAPGIDAHILILGLVNGAELGEIDNTTQGYFDAWQPYVTAGPMSESYLEWRISFKKAGTNIDTALECLAVTAVDVDGDNKFLQEFVEAATPGAYAVDPFNTTLNVTFDGVRTKAVGMINTIQWIDTAARQAMFQMNFSNVSTIDYRNGAISTRTDKDMRHTCIYFRPFFMSFITLPVHLLSFNVTPGRDENTIRWTAADERDVLKYTIQKSEDGKNWNDLTQVFPYNNGALKNSYAAADKSSSAGTVYYRIKYAYAKSIAYSSILVIRSSSNDAVLVSAPTRIQAGTIPVQLQTNKATQVQVSLTSMQGTRVAASEIRVQQGSHLLHLPVASYLADGMYLLTIKDATGSIIASKKLIKPS